MVTKKNSFEDFMNTLKNVSLGQMFNYPAQVMDIDKCENEEFKKLYKTAKDAYLKIQNMRNVYFAKKELAEKLNVPFDVVENATNEWIAQGKVHDFDYVPKKFGIIARSAHDGSDYLDKIIGEIADNEIKRKTHNVSEISAELHNGDTYQVILSDSQYVGRTFSDLFVQNGTPKEFLDKLIASSGLRTSRVAYFNK